jgi:hypothetical protein
MPKQLTERDVIELIKRYSRSGGSGGAGHARLHDITSALDHTSNATPGSVLMADSNGLPVDATSLTTGHYRFKEDSGKFKLQYSSTGSDPWADTGNEWS